MNILIQKFGGTSVESESSRAKVVEKVKKALDRGKSVVVVVSAMGRKPSPYATDSIIDLVNNIDPDLNARERDAIMSCGENISAVVMVAALSKAGVKAISLTGGQAGIFTNDNYSDARIKRIDPTRIMSILSSGTVAVVTGFQGITETFDVATLGRGGSDTTASALGAALGAELVEIYTDVEGIMTADPRVVPDAKYQEVVSYRDLVEMANLGAKVVHPRAVEIAMQARIPLAIKNTFTDDPGTLVTDIYKSTVSVPAHDKVVLAVAHMTGVAQIKCEEETYKQHSALDVFTKLAEVNISVDMVNVSPDQMNFIVAEKDVARTVEALGSMDIKVSAVPGCSKVSIIGGGMMGIPGVMSRFIRALDKAEVSILQTTDSHNSVSCLVPSEHMEIAARALHAEFELSK